MTNEEAVEEDVEERRRRIFNDFLEIIKAEKEASKPGLEILSLADKLQTNEGYVQVVLQALEHGKINDSGFFREEVVQYVLEVLYDPRRAIELIRLEKNTERRLDLYEKHGFHEQAVGLAVGLEDYERAVKNYVSAGNVDGAKRLIETKVSSIDQRIKLYELAGLDELAGMWAWATEDYDSAIQYLNKAGQSLLLGTLIVRSSKGDKEKELNLLEQAGFYREASITALEMGDHERELINCEKAGNFIDSARIAKNIGEKELAEIYDTLFDLLKR